MSMSLCLLSCIIHLFLVNNLFIFPELNISDDNTYSILFVNIHIFITKGGGGGGG